MNALLIHSDGRTQVLSGDAPVDPMTIAVLTQAATSALDEVSTRTDQGWLTEVHLRNEHGRTALFRINPETWLRVEHEESDQIDQVREWARQLMQSSPTEVLATPTTSRISSLADALNVGMP
jgi:predicted regulator of Ras-like GTPase activity (Roadblock/LC7/MglB family)